MSEGRGDWGRSENNSDVEGEGEVGGEAMHGDDDAVDIAAETGSQSSSGGLLRVRRHLLQCLDMRGIGEGPVVDVCLQKICRE